MVYCECLVRRAAGVAVDDALSAAPEAQRHPARRPAASGDVRGEEGELVEEGCFSQGVR